MLSDRKIIVTGHKNPDTDSICSAIAYADIKNRISQSHKYEPRRAGEISSETKFVLDKFKVEVPEYIGDVATQVKDMEIRRTKGVKDTLTIQKAWSKMTENGAVTLPITTEEGKVIGLATKGDIARAFMEGQDNYFLSQSKASFQDIADTVKGKIVIGDKTAIFSEGKVLIGAAVPERMEQVVEPHDLIILVDRYENHMAALKKDAGCLILCLGAHADIEVRKEAEKRGTVIIETPLDTFSVSREINQSVPLSAIMIKEGITSFKTDDYTGKVKATMASTRHRAFPIVDDNGKYIGTVSRRNLLGIKKKQVVLVDHNEKSQAVDNIDDADILEIIDHHRLGTLQTMQPIYFVNQPVGCTATILYQMYVEKGIEIAPDIAGLMCSAIISDTLMFRSPTCTLYDKMAAGALALIAEIDIEKFAAEMFRAGSDLRGKSAEEVFYQDYKKFTFGSTTFGVGQISSMSSTELNNIKKKILPLLNNECGKNGISMAFFLLTNIKDSSSEIIFAGEKSEDIITRAFKNSKKTEDGYFLEGLLSRKKQLIPEFMKVINNR